VSSWLERAQRKHPSALGSFDDIAAAAKGKKIVMFMDYDGTLSPIVADPDKAFMSAEVSDESYIYLYHRRSLSTPPQSIDLFLVLTISSHASR
jgi:hypothetical protein